MCVCGRKFSISVWEKINIVTFVSYPLGLPVNTVKCCFGDQGAPDRKSYPRPTSRQDPCSS